jgi:hypothetical protein
MVPLIRGLCALAKVFKRFQRYVCEAERQFFVGIEGLNLGIDRGRFSLKSWLFFFIIGLLLSVQISSKTNAATLSVPAGGNLQAALDSAQCGDTVVLAAGATFVVPDRFQPFIARNRGVCTGTNSDFITIQSSGALSLSAGATVKPQDASFMARLVANGSTPALEFEGGSHHYRVIGLEITNDSGGGTQLNNGLVYVGENSGNQLQITLANVPHDIEFDRCYVHAEATDGTTSEYSTAIRGFSVSAKNLTIKNSRIAGFRIFWKPGFTNPLSSNAVLINKGPGPYTITGNYMEAWFGTIFTGGGPQWVTNSASVAAGATLNQATLTNVVGTMPAVGDYVAFLAPNMIYAVGVNHGQPYEWGAARVTAVNGTTISYVPQKSNNLQSAWGEGFGGTPLTSAPSAPGMVVWNGDRPKDILIEHNQFVKEPVSLASVYQQYGFGPKGHIELKVGLRTTVNANTFEGYHLAFVITSRNQSSVAEGGGKQVWSTIDDTVFSNNWVKPAPGPGHVFGIFLEDETCTVMPGSNFRIENNLFQSGTKFLNVGVAKNVTVAHNTFTGNSGVPTDTDQAVFAVGGPNPNFQMRDNIFYNNNAALNCQVAPGTMGACWPGLGFTGNVVIDNRTVVQQVIQGLLSLLYPSGNYYPNTISEVQFVDPVMGNWSLAASSPFKGRGSNGSDPGVDMNSLRVALGNLYPAGSSPTPTPTPTPTPSPSPTPTPTPGPTPVPLQFSIVTTDSNTAAVINSLTMMPAPFDVLTIQNFGSDHGTRLTVFATGITSAAQDSDHSNDLVVGGVTIPNYAESVSLEARRSDGAVFLLPVEFAGVLGTIPPLEQVNVVLVPDLENARNVQLTLIINGQRSNSASIFVR